MALDPRYIPVNTFQEIFLDKDDGCVLAGGIVKFYEDDSRITPKEVFKISGAPPNYTYVSLGTEVTLSSIGTFEDGSGNDITVYLYPYDSSGTIQLYYATVESSGAVQQFTREGFPNITQEEEPEVKVPKNYIFNGQFLLHNPIIANNKLSGEITSPITNVAEGGWTFNRSQDSTATDVVSFHAFGGYVTSPTSSPKYAIRVVNEAIGTGTVYKELRYTFEDVNKFAANDDFFTFAFEALSFSGSPSNISVVLIKNYGIGGAAEEKTIIQNISLTTSYVLYDIPFKFGDNLGKSIGTDSFVALAISFPVGNVFQTEFTNFVLTDDDVQITSFPDTPNEEFIRDSLAGRTPIPNYVNENIYLPILLGQQGFMYDRSIIGKYVIKSDDSLLVGERWADGSKYLTALYAGSGIPNRRLYDKWSASSHEGLAIYGMGAAELYMGHTTTIEDQKFLKTEDHLPIKGGPNWGFQTITAGITGTWTSLSLYFIEIDSVTIKIYDGPDPQTDPLLSTTVVTSPAKEWNTIRLTTEVSQVATQQYAIEIIGNPPYHQLPVVGGSKKGGYTGGSWSLLAGSDIAFKTFVQTSSTSDHELKSTSAGAVTPAADGATPTGFTFTPVQPDPYIVKITFVAGSSVPASSYFTYHTTDARKYIVWYKVDGSGTQPVESADVYREVFILSTDTADTVGNKTAKIINSYSYALPDVRGRVLRVTDDGAGIDPDAGTRTDRGDEVTGDAVGTLQPGTLTDGTGAIEARIPNINVKVAIKY